MTAHFYQTYAANAGWIGKATCMKAECRIGCQRAQEKTPGPDLTVIRRAPGVERKDKPESIVDKRLLPYNATFLSFTSFQPTELASLSWTARSGILPGFFSAAQKATG